MKIVFSYIILFFQLTTLFSQEVIDKVIAVVGEKPILYSQIQSQKLQILQQGWKLLKIWIVSY